MTPSDHKYPGIEPSMLKTPERIIYAAMRVFARHPYENASIRMIAKEADVTISSILYHFKSKEKLYQAVFNRVVPARKKFLDKNDVITFDDAKKLLVDLLGELIDGMYCEPDEDCCTKILFFEYFFPSPFYEKFYEIYFRRTRETLPKLVMILTDGDDPRKAFLQAVSIVGLVVCFPMEREVLVKRLGMTGFNGKEIRELKDLVIRNAFLLLGIDPPPIPPPERQL